MTMELTSQTILHRPRPARRIAENGTAVWIDPDGPNWITVDAAGEKILSRFDGRTPLGEIITDYAAETGYEVAKAWQHVDTVARDALRRNFLTPTPPTPTPYAGRAAHLRLEKLEELWLHTNNSCNLACRHCLVSSGPDGDPGLPTETLLEVIGQARALGTQRFYFTGGEPLLRKDFYQLAEMVLDDPEAELAVLTNGTLLKGKRLESLGRFDKERFRLQISLDGSTSATNDPIRGAATFEPIVAGIRNAVAAGFDVTVTTAITAGNADDVPNVTRLLADLGVRNHHLLWLHKRGRAGGDGAPDTTPPVPKVIEVVRRCRAVGREAGVAIDNCESMQLRLNAPAGVKRDLSNACVNSLCVSYDGAVYPSAATAGVPELRCGSIRESSLEGIWREGEVPRRFRAVSLENKPICRDCDLKFLCGGGDLEHAYFYGGALDAHDPYCELHQAMIADALIERAVERRIVHGNGKTGFNAPVLFTGMGEGAVHCATDTEIAEVMTTHSECVRSFDLDAPRKRVREFYGDAAEAPQEDLCCPVRPDPEDLAHIPSEVVDRFYGCGSPVADAALRAGERFLDLGAGAGIDVFIAAKKVGPTGRAIGVDMTDRMLGVAEANRPIVAANLGYDVVEFRKGYLEAIPAEDVSVDVLTSNCVINLSPDKKRVFAEMWRVLADHGRAVVADIVSEEEVPLHQRQDPRLWGECISGALTEEEFLAEMERAGFYGIRVLKKTFWKEVEGYRFFSVTVQGTKFEKKAGCVFLGQRAVYAGPWKGVADEEGHFFPRGAPVEICTDTAAKLSHPPYAGLFQILEPGEESADFRCCDPEGDCC